MQDLIKRYFWVLGAVVVMTCMVFAAKCTNHIIEAKAFNDPEHGPKITPVISTPSTPVKPIRTKDGTQLAQRDMFCSDCKPAEEPAHVDNGSIQMTSLPSCCSRRTSAPSPSSRTRRSSTPPASSRVRSRSATRSPAQP